MSKIISLTGNLHYFYLSNILQLISSNHKTGSLFLSFKKKNVSIIFRDGTIIFASGNKTESKLGNLLISKGKISNSQLRNFLKRTKKRGIALGKLLVEDNIISSETLKSVVKHQIEEILYDIFLCEGGSFRFDESTPNLERIIVSPLDLVSLILEASRRIDEMTVLKEHIPNNNIVYTLSEETKRKNIEFISNEWSILNLIDGKRNIDEIIEMSNLDTYTIYKMLFSLVSSGFIVKK